MMRARSVTRGLSLLTIGLLLAGCTTSTPAPAATDATARRAKFEAAWTAFHEGLRANDVDKAFALVADDVVMMPPGEPVLRGKSAARDWYTHFVAQYRTAALTFPGRETIVGDELMVDLGGYEWHLTPVAGGDTIVDRGSYLQVWTQTSDGQWRFAREIWNSGPPPSGNSR